MTTAAAGPRWTDLRRPLAALTAVQLGLLLTWSLVVPTFRGADENVHHDFLRHLTTTWSYPDYDGLRVSRRTLDATSSSPAFVADGPAVDADAATHRADRPGWADLGPDVRNGPPNQMPQHPPLYYEAAGAALRVIDGDGTMPLDRAVWLLRLLSVLAMAPLPLIAADVARRFTASRAIVLAAAAGVLAVPQLTHLGATVSNDPLMILLGSLTLAGVARLATGDQRRGVLVATGVLAGLTMFTKGFGVPVAPAVALACLLPLLRRAGTRAPAQRTLGRAALVAALAFAFGGWWWVRNALVYGTPQPGVRLRERVPDVDLDVMRFAGDFSERLVGSFWGNFGWFEARLPIALSAGLTVVMVVAIVAACWGHLPRAVLVLPAAAASLMVLSAGWGAFKKTGVSYATQGRYLFTGIVGLMVLVALGVARLNGGRVRWQPVATLGLALGLQGASLWICLDRYWAGPGVGDQVRAMTRFAPVPGAVTTTIVAATALAGAAALGTLWARAGEGPPDA
jgi:4-amino-4-deoxy-L-arabinose transferase-like glycosyltransferase